MPNNLQIISQTKNRVRFICDELDASSDARHLEAQILELDNVTSVRVNRAAKSIIIEYKGALTSIIKALEPVQIRQNKNTHHAISKTEIYKSLLALGITSISKDRFINTLVSAICSKNLFIEGAKALKDEGLNSRTLEALAVGVSLVRGDFLAANGTSLLLNIGEYIEESTEHKSDELIKELARPNVKEAWIEVVENGKKELKLVPCKDIKKGDIVVVGTGESIAIDGYIVEGSASINQVSMTGEAEPVAKTRGDRVMSGTIVDDGRIKIWAELIGDETATSRIKSYIQASLNEKSAITLKATKLADKLVPVTLGLAGLSYIINGNATPMASVLQADYSCALKLATPTAFKTNIAKAGKEGILVKGAKAIEALANADTFVFDKTGTLTHGSLVVADVYSFDSSLSTHELLNLTASAEEHYFHPVAEAVVKAAKEAGFAHIHHDEVEFIVAHGVRTHIKGKKVVIGSRHFLEDDERIDFNGHRAKLDEIAASGHALLYIGYNERLIGVIALRDDIRANSKECIAKLKANGVKEVIMITGDTQKKAAEVAKELGIDRYFAGCLPTDKAGIIEKLRAQGRNIAFIGDGINDAPSLVKANVGISMSKGADIAKASADISLLKDDIASVAHIKAIANNTMKKIHTNFNITVGVNSAILVGATLGKLSPLATGMLHNGTTVGLLLNALNPVKD